ncbi:MAG: hypothetical protein JOZ10_04290 [Acidobacteria bacterium]|nr:hypothetical protein [Acidobacteriota bacterium]
MGKITEAHSRVTPDEESVVTHYRFQVYRTIKEQNRRVNVNDIIEFTGPGGKSSLQGAPVRTTPGDFPLLFPGATYVLMFSPIPSSPRYHVEGAEFGVYKIEDDNSVHCAYGRGLKGTPCDKSLQEFVQSIEQLVR